MCINVDLFIVAMNNCEFIANKPTKYVDLYHINPQLFLRHLYENKNGESYFCDPEGLAEISWYKDFFLAMVVDPCSDVELIHQCNKIDLIWQDVPYLSLRWECSIRLMMLGSQLIALTAILCPY